MGKLLVVLAPHTLQHELLQEVHEGITGSYLQEKKSLGCLRQHFYWVGIWWDVQE